MGDRAGVGSPAGAPAGTGARPTLALWILSFGGLGFLPLVPGTFGTLGGVAVALLLPAGAWLPSVALAVAAASALTVILGPAACRAAGRPDPQAVVMDEVAGVLLALAVVPDPSPLEAGMGFLLFRAFDILKPPPARALERLPGGWGILMDNLAAGIYAAAGLWLLGRLIPLA